MLDWNTPKLSDKEWIEKCVKESQYIGSDAAFANIYLLRSKYNIKVTYYKDLLIRYYEGLGNRKGYTFPLGRKDVLSALYAIEQDAKEMNRPLEFCFVTEEQKEILENTFAGRTESSSDAGDYDYIYGQPELSLLSGRIYHKKKNHVSKFKRTYEDYMFCEIGNGNLDDVMLIEDEWYYDRLQQDDTSAMKEYEAIREAVDNFEELSLSGGIIYANNVPVAMTIASYINDAAVDIHFEKAVGEYAVNGGFAAINQMYASTLKDVKFINREENINIPGLRKAKESYHSKFMLKKYGVRVK